MKNKSFKIIISPNGIVTSVYSDIMNLQRIGRPIIHRATDVRFDNVGGYWIVEGLLPYFCRISVLQIGLKSRAVAIEWEIEYLNKHLGEIIEAKPKGGYIPRKKENFECKDAQTQEKIV